MMISMECSKIAVERRRKDFGTEEREGHQSGRVPALPEAGGVPGYLASHSVTLELRQSFPAAVTKGFYAV
jgi:hypothetical protein